jgi:chromate reductase
MIALAMNAADAPTLPTPTPSTSAPGAPTPLSAPAAAAIALWRLDPATSTVRFTARQMGMVVRGRFPLVEGDLRMRLDRLDASSIEAVVPTGRVEPAMAALTGLLLSDSFLAAETYPELRFRSERIEPLDDGYLVHGRLTFRGESRAVAFSTRIADVEHAAAGALVRIEGHATVDRLISDEELEIELSLVAVPAVEVAATLEMPDATRPAAVTGTRPAVTDASAATSAASQTRRQAPGVVPPAAHTVGSDTPVQPLRIAAFVGSTRTESLNGALLAALREVAPRGTTIEALEISSLPFYNGDLDGDAAPPSVVAVREAITAADALLVVTPEYNRGLPAVIKNAIDWASRPAFASPLVGKHVLLTGATSGRSAVKYALEDAAQALAFTQAIPFERRYGVARAGDLVDADCRLSDVRTTDELRELLAHFATTVQRAAATSHLAA